MTDRDVIGLLLRVKQYCLLTSHEMKALDIAIAALERDRWIPVTERLPEVEERYLTAVDFGEGSAMQFITAREFYLFGCDQYGKDKYEPHFENEGFKGLRTLAWRPLPEPYKEG